MMDRSASLTAASPPRSDRCNAITSRRRRTHVERPSTSGSTADPLVTRERADGGIVAMARLSDDIVFGVFRYPIVTRHDRLCR